MKVDASQVSTQGGVNTNKGVSASADSVKTAAAAGLGAEGNAEEDLSVAKPNLMRGFSDLSLEPYAAKLAELGMNVTEEAARGMRDLMGQYPKLTMEEAAFIASNKVGADEGMIRAALEVVSGGEKTSSMITQIISALKTETGKQEFLVNQDLGTRDPENSNDGPALSGRFNVSDSGRAPLTELIAAVVKNAPGLLNASGTPDLPSGKITSPIIPQTNINMQINDEKLIENIQKPATFDLVQQSAVPETGQGEVAQNVAIAGFGKGIGIEEGIILNNGAGAVPAAEETAIEPKTQMTPPEAAGQAQEGSQNEAKSMTGAVAQLLSGIPEFQGTPQAALDRFSDMLLRIARDTGTIGDDAKAKNVDMLAAQLEKLFTKIDSKDPDAGTRLRQAREELFARLTLVQEEIAGAAQPMKEQLLGQTQKLMDHVRLLNNIDQFVYMQLPVSVRDEQKTAELYVFKRKGGKRADPDNVNILLAIDLEFMGHWEALLNIKGKDVYLNMEVAGEREKEHFNANTVLLHELLAEEGFKLVNTSIKISQEETTPLTVLSAFDRYSGKQLSGRIDFKI